MLGYQGGNSSFQNVSVRQAIQGGDGSLSSCMMDRLKDTNARLTRWSLLLQSYDFLVEHRKGLKNGNADGLSRGPWHQEAANDFAGEEGGRNVRVREPDPLDRGDVISELGPPREPYGHIVVQWIEGGRGMFWNVLECSTVAIYIVRGYGQ